MTRQDLTSFIEGLEYQYETNYKNYTKEQLTDEIRLDLQSIVRLIKAKKIDE